MKITELATVCRGQDGAICNGLLFRFDHRGNCQVTDLSSLSEISAFTLPMADRLAPHSNSVTFGGRFSPEDEFPLLYSNVYNNFASAENKRKGQCLVYRLQRQGNAFSASLMGLIAVGFTEDPLWCSAPGSDVRPYGNFAADAENGLLHVFTMRDASNTGRYFTFRLPSPSDFRDTDPLGLPLCTLSKEDVISFFDAEYPRYIQGACFKNGLIYSVEGFTNSAENPPAIRLVDPREQKQVFHTEFSGFGLTNEPELIDFWEDICIYGDNEGNLYKLDF